MSAGDAFTGSSDADGTADVDAARDARAGDTGIVEPLLDANPMVDAREELVDAYAQDGAHDGSTEPIDLGRERDAGDDAGSCDPPLTICDGSCVYPEADEENCGACGHRCCAGEECSFGRCYVFECGAFGSSVSCPPLPGETCMQCLDVGSDYRHCGSCDLECAPGQYCRTGTCEDDACLPGESVCPGGCFDLSSDPAHCGECGIGCGPGAECISGSCRLFDCADPSHTNCGGWCVELTSNPSHCGTCGHRCSDAEACIGGRCGTCPVGQVPCAGACVDPTRDPRNCGGCDRACGASPGSVATCSGSRCDVVCDDGLILEDRRCVSDARRAIPRLLAPGSTSRVTRSPLLRWQSGAGTDATRIELCSDRACSDVIQTVVTSSMSARPSSDLPRGPVFWRALGIRGGLAGSDASPTWEMFVGASTASTGGGCGVIPDFDGDGFPEIVVGAHDPAAFVYSGGSAGPDDIADTLLRPPSGTFDLTTTAVGDVNGDGFGDALLSQQDGPSWTLLGSESGLVASPSSILLPPSGGWTPAAVGDIDGDGFADVAIPSPYGRAPRGAIFIHRGGPAGPSRYPDYVIEGADEESFGSAVFALSDIDADGLADFGARFVDWSEEPFRLGLRVFRGSVAGPTTADATEIGEPEPSASTFAGVLATGDFDGDGDCDAAVGAPGAPAFVASGVIMSGHGRVYVYSGGPDGLTTSPVLSIDGWPLGGIWSFGGVLVGESDFDGDGRDDVAVGWIAVPDDGTGMFPHAVMPLLGDPIDWLRPTFAYVAVAPSATWQTFGALGDLDGDGLSDLGAATNYPAEARAFRGTTDGSGIESTEWLTIREEHVWFDSIQ